MNAKLKKVAGFLVCSNAFSQRNVTSIGLVGVFLLVYVLAGGKITTQLPRMQGGLGSSGVESIAAKKRSVIEEIQNADSIPDLSEEESEGVLGVRASSDKVARERARAKMGSLFTEEERKRAEQEAIDQEGLITGADFTSRREQFLLEQSEKRPSDSLSAIEERLKINKRRKN